MRKNETENVKRVRSEIECEKIRREIEKNERENSLSLACQN